MPYDASNRKEIRRAEKRAALLAEARAEFLVAAMSTTQGRTWFHDLLSDCRLFSDPFTGEALREAFSKGERNVGLRIYNEIVTHCPDAFVSMMREAAARNIEDAARSSATDDRDSAPGSDPDPGSGADAF